MLTLKQIITFSRRILGDNTSRDNLRIALKGRVGELYDGATDDQMIYFDTTTGRHPFLVTTAGTYQYDYPSWAKYILQVYDANLAQEDTEYYPDFPVTADNTNKKITFSFDPGTETTKYKIKGIFGPTDITSENDTLLVVPKDSRFPLLPVGIVSAYQPDKKGYSLPYWNELKEEYRRKLRIGAQPNSDIVEMKTEFQAGYGLQVSDYRKRVS